MRKYTKFILAFLLINIISNTAYANILSTTFDDTTDAITISGSVEDCADSKVFIQILNPGVTESDITNVSKDNFKDVFSNVFEVSTDSKGCFEAPSYTPSKSGSHSIRIKYGADAPVMYEDAFFYMTKDYEDSVFLPGLNSDDEQAIQYITDNADLTCGFDSNYKYLSAEYLQKASECAIAERNLDLTQKFDSREDFETVMKASVMINLMENHKNSIAQIFSHYIADTALRDAYSPLMLCNGFVSEEPTARIVSEAIDQNDYISVSDFLNDVGEKLILAAIADVDIYMNVETILTQQEEFFGFDLKDYKKIKDKSAVNKAIAKSDPKDINELKSVIKKEVGKHFDDGKISYGGSGGSSSGRAPSSAGGGSVNVNISPTVTDDKIIADASPFTDTDDVMWAKTAIDTLYGKGIINGTSSECFSPHNNVTREEFVKLLTLTFVPKLSDSVVDFSDVKPDDWFYPYIADAYSRGLVKGISDSEFGTKLPITRQDMAVLAYRYALVYGSSDEFVSAKNFSDSYVIADYAKEAVHNLAGAGVINGTGNGCFEPASYCSRAQAAVVIYNLTKFMEG